MDEIRRLENSSPEMQHELQLDRFSRRVHGGVVAAGLLILFLIAIPLDTRLSNLAHDCGSAGYLKAHEKLAHFIRIPGDFRYTLVAVAGLLCAAWFDWQRIGRKVLYKAVLVFSAGVFSGMNAFLKFVFGRSRPFHGIPLYELHPFRGGLAGQWRAELALSFPSGDASCAFATSIALSMVLPRLWPIWWLLALVVAVERVAENAHYPTDIVGGLAVGVLSALLARKLTRWIFRRSGIPPLNPEILSEQSRGGQVS